MGGNHMRAAVLTSLVLVLIPTGVSAFEDQEQESRLLSDRWNVGLGTYLVDFRTAVQVGSGRVLGTFVRLESDLGLDRYNRSFLLDGFYRGPRGWMVFYNEFARCWIYARTGKRKEARATLDAVLHLPECDSHALPVACLFFLVGDNENGLEWLRRAVDDQFYDLRRLRAFYLPRAALKDPRFEEILEPTGMPLDGMRSWEDVVGPME